MTTQAARTIENTLPLCREGQAERICIVLHDLSGGGTERVAITLAGQWAADGRQVTVFCGSASGVLRAMVPAGVRLVQPTPACPRGFGSRLRLARALADFVMLHPQDVVFAPGNYHLPVLAHFAAIARGAATTVCKISNPLLRGKATRLAHTIRERSLRRLTRNLNCMVAMSPALHSEAQDQIASADLALAWEPILPAPALLLSDRRMRSRPLIVAAGRLEPQKDFTLAIRAFALVAGRIDAELLILGEGQERPRLERLAARLGIADRVRMPGHRASIADALAEASAFLLSSRFEGYPAVLVEAIVAGTPVVTTACSTAIPEIVSDGLTGEIVERSAPALAAGLMRALDRDRRPQHDAATFLHARHGIDQAARAYLGILDTAHARRLGRVP